MARRWFVGAVHDRETDVTRMVYADGGEPLSETAKALLDAGFQSESIECLVSGGTFVRKARGKRGETYVHDDEAETEVLHKAARLVAAENPGVYLWEGERSVVLFRKARHDVRDKRTGRFTGRREVLDVAEAGGLALPWKRVATPGYRRIF